MNGRVQHNPPEQRFLIQRGKDKDGQQRQDHVRYGLIGKKFRHKWLSRQSQRLTEQKYTDIHHGHRTDQPRYANVAQLTNDR
ncbi:hypothetical protein NBY13_24890 (plasmid) [Escherichia coli]|nr:hypothetical protein [Escherichia coli]URV18520.1 hypothetical protein NBY13_24130 [Escherichia coli]URV18678.1 hypothetical protein NBY13_24890 [Escherichia coli]